MHGLGHIACVNEKGALELVQNLSVAPMTSLPFESHARPTMVAFAPTGPTRRVSLGVSATRATGTTAKLGDSAVDASVRSDGSLQPTVSTSPAARRPLAIRAG